MVFFYFRLGMDRVLVKYWVNGLDMTIVNIILNIENHFKGLLCNCKTYT